MDDNLDRVAQSITIAVVCEDIFGNLSGSPPDMLDTAKRLYRQMARVVHPDKYTDPGDNKKAKLAFQKLTEFFSQAESAIENGTYGKRMGEVKMEPVTIKVRNREYTITSYLTVGDICTLYNCEFTDKAGMQISGIIKVARDPADNDLVANEARVLKRLVTDEADERYHPYFPVPRDSFLYKDTASSPALRASVLTVPTALLQELAKRGGDLYTLREIRDHFTTGIDLADMAWIWRRLLLALGATHIHKVIHGAVLPTHILIQPESHAVLLIDWSYAVLDPDTSGEHISAISREYETWYPPEVMKKLKPTPGTDIYMAARSMVYALGGDPLKSLFPASVPVEIQRFLKSCLIEGPSLRPQDALALHKEYGQLIEQLYGPRKFHKFTMPPRK